jgi:hypothetical protein
MRVGTSRRRRIKACMRKISRQSPLSANWEQFSLLQPSLRIYQEATRIPYGRSR